MLGVEHEGAGVDDRLLLERWRRRLHVEAARRMIEHVATQNRRAVDLPALRCADEAEVGRSHAHVERQERRRHQLRRALCDQDPGRPERREQSRDDHSSLAVAYYGQRRFSRGGAEIRSGISNGRA
jgi:hypothetical protein